MLAVAFVLSLLFHLFGGAVWGETAQLVARTVRRLPDEHQREQQVATSDVIRLEKRTIPRPANRSRARPASLRIVAILQPRGHRPVPQPASPAPSAQSAIAHTVKHAALNVAEPHAAQAAGSGATARAVRKAVLSATQIAQLNAQFAQFNAQFAKTIASSRVDLATIQKRTEERPVATKRYPMQFTGMQASLQRGEGYIEPTTAGQRIGGKVWYYTHYTYMWPDGHIEDDDIPWPFRFPFQHDLFALHVHLIPLQAPPPGFRLNRSLKPFLAQFLRRAEQS